MSQKDEFSEEKWDELKAAMEQGGPDAAARYIMGFEDLLARRKLFFFAHQAFIRRDWQGKDIDKVARLTQAGIDEMLQQSDAANDSELKNKYKNLGNIMSFNLSANMADCWPGDDVPRDEKQFEVGLTAAKNCLRWREELEGEPSHFSMAWWAKGMHELSLGKKDDSLASFIESRDFAIQAAKKEGNETSISPKGHWSVLLGEGYVAIANCALGNQEARSSLKSCYAALEEGRKVQPEQAGDLDFCLAQLRKVEGKYLPN